MRNNKKEGYVIRYYDDENNLLVSERSYGYPSNVELIKRFNEYKSYMPHLVKMVARMYHMDNAGVNLIEFKSGSFTYII